MLRLRTLASALIVGAALSAPVEANDDLEQMSQFLDLMSGYYDIIESTHAISSNPEKAAILQMQKLKEVLDERGETARAVQMFQQVLSESSNPTIRAAATLLLSETLKETGRADEAVKLLVQGLKESVAAADGE